MTTLPNTDQLCYSDNMSNTSKWLECISLENMAATLPVTLPPKYDSSKSGNMSENDCDSDISSRLTEEDSSLRSSMSQFTEGHGSCSSGESASVGEDYSRFSSL